jgi:hypothetical protein
MEPFKALIVPLKKPTLPPEGTNPPEINHDLPLFPFVPIVVPPGGAWPGEPPVKPPDGEPPEINHDLPLFVFVPIVIPPGGAYPPNGGTQPPTDPNAPAPSNPINLPPSDTGYWIFVYIPDVGWCWIAISPQPLPPNETHPQPK